MRSTAFAGRRVIQDQQRWLGPSYTLTDAGVVPDDEHGGLMLFTAGSSVLLDRTAAVTYEDRPGDAW